MVTNQPARAEITNFGSVRRIVGPPGWNLSNESPSGMATRQVQVFRPADTQDVAITLFYRGIPIDEESANYFSKLLQKPLEPTETFSLQPEMIKALSRVMGSTTAGDNQYTNTAPKGTNLYHVFNLRSAELVKVNGRTGLKVAGTFQTEKGLPNNEYQGYFFATQESPAEIDEIFYQAPTQGKFLRYIAHFDQSLKSIEWR